MTAPLSSPDPTAGPHPSVDELADLSEDLLAPAEAEVLREHLAGCADCRETVDALSEVRELLGAADSPAVPSDVAARIDAALAAAAGAPTPATVPTAAPVVPAARPTPGTPPKAPPARPTAGTGPGRPRRGRRRALLLGSAAALLALGLGGAFLSLSSSGRQDLSATADAAAKPAAGTAAPESSAAGARTDRSPDGTVYRDDVLADQVGQLLAASGTARPVKPSAGPGSVPGSGADSGPATESSKAPGATAVPPAEGDQGLVGGNRSTPACPPPSTAALLATDRGSYAGTAADLLVYALPGRPELLDVYLRAPDCGPVLRHLTVPRP
ncbi:zf-HC2 domain-containing protein [Kitasatospora purpeofusca]|uniref:anti-sigma factor family protein n=1 Tax=Kitasatospora purpeofusca TaxID=67352 RepID=UPI002252D067|nr:zf-HC2 domain-containing protein [Kitasatospora purpeofusca]MCX4686815.1 zf-HC2 domain-containing protein [Kitasatospora purpeofusca]